jgi:hypothetical protein
MADTTRYRLIGKIGGEMKAATSDMHEFARSGQAGLRRKFFAETDAALPDDERERRAEHLYQAHLARIRAKAHAARRAKGRAK